MSDTRNVKIFNYSDHGGANETEIAVSDYIKDNNLHDIKIETEREQERVILRYRNPTSL